MPGGFEFETQFQQQKVEPYLKHFKSELQKTRVDTSAQTIKSWFESKDHKYGLTDLEISKPLMLAALDPAFMNEADAKASADPMLFHGYYRSVLKGLNSGANDVPLSVRRKAAQEIADRLNKLGQSGGLDHSGVIRLNDLIKRIPQFPAEPAPAPDPAAATPAHAAGIPS